MTPLPLTLTDAGRAALTAAAGTAAITIAAIGLSADDIIVSRTLTALPGEHRRIEAVSGIATDPFTVHMVSRDDGADSYTVRAIGVYLDDDTLFAVYGQSDPIFEKASVASYHQAIDLRFENAEAELIEFGDANFLLPPATEQTPGIAPIAGADAVDAGEDHGAIVTPFGLKHRLTSLLANVFARRVDTSGLATGGGDLTADRTIAVPAASVAEVDAGTDAAKAVTPASLANVLAAIAARVPLTRRIDTDGLALGGGALGTDRTISVPSATVEQMRAATAANVAVTPAAIGELAKDLDSASGYLELPGGFVLQWINYRGLITNEPSLNAAYPIAFANRCVLALPIIYVSGAVTGRDVTVQLRGEPGLASCGLQFQVAANSPSNTVDGYNLILLGY